MAAMMLWGRADLRRRWRSFVALILLAGLPAGLALAAASGASRTDSVVDRLVARTRPPQIFYVPYFQETKVAFNDMARIPVVSEALIFHGYGSLPPGPEDLEISAPVGADVPPGRTHLVSGRTPRPGSVDEATINFISARRFGWNVGDVVPITLAGAGTDFFGESPPVPGVAVRAKIVGISADPGDFVGIAGPGMTFGAAFARSYDPRAASLDLYTFSLARGAADLPAFEQGLNRLTGGRGILPVEGSSGVEQVRRTFHIQATALWVLSLSLGLVVALIFGQAFARQTLLQSVDHGTLRALGSTRRDLAMFAVLRAGAVAVSATILAAISAAALSPLAPLGTARLAEPDPGFSVPASTFVGGAAIVLGLIFLLAVVPSLLAVRAVTRSGSKTQVRPSAVARLMSVLTRRPAPGVGARFALEPGRGATAVPVRTSLAASITGIVALLAALIVGASLQHLLATPSLYGQNWDITIGGDFAGDSKDVRDLTSDPATADVSVGFAGEGGQFLVRTVGPDGQILGRATMNGVAVDPVKGELEPTLLSGRMPEGASEVALGPKTMQTVRARVGGMVRVGLVGTDASEAFRVVGEIVLPFDDDVTSVGEGLWTTLDVGRKLASYLRDPEGAPLRLDPDVALVRLAPHIDREAAIARLQKRFPVEEGGAAVPRTIRGMGRMSNLPAALAAILAVLAAGTLAHMLTTSIRRRRRDLAILKTIGFARGQVRSAVEWQAIVFTLVALAISVPLGIVIGRWSWNLIAAYGGFASAPTVPMLQVGIVALSALAVAAALAALPARSAARTRPALVLRSE